MGWNDFCSTCEHRAPQTDGRCTQTGCQCVCQYKTRFVKPGFSCLCGNDRFVRPLDSEQIACIQCGEMWSESGMTIAQQDECNAKEEQIKATAERQFIALVASWRWSSSEMIQPNMGPGAKIRSIKKEAYFYASIWHEDDPS